MADPQGLLKALKRIRSLKEKGEKDLNFVDMVTLLEMYLAGTTMQKDLVVLLERDHRVVAANASQALKRLIEKYRFVTRSPAPENYRLNVLSLSPRGKTFVEDILRDLQ